MNNKQIVRSGLPVSRALITMTAIAYALCIASSVLLQSHNWVWFLVWHFLIWSVIGAELRRTSLPKHDRPIVVISAEQQRAREDSEP